jgi:hypothetical protein
MPSIAIHSNFSKPTNSMSTTTHIYQPRHPYQALMLLETQNNTYFTQKKIPRIGIHSKIFKWKCKNQMSHIHIHIQCNTCEGTHTELELEIRRELDLREWGVCWNCALRVVQEEILVWLRGVVAAQQARGGVAMAAIASNLLELLQQSWSSHTLPSFVLSFPSLKSMNCVDLLSIHLSLSTSLSYCRSSSHIYKGRRLFTFLCALLSPYILSYKMHYTKYDV